MTGCIQTGEFPQSEMRFLMKGKKIILGLSFGLFIGYAAAVASHVALALPIGAVSGIALGLFSDT